MKMISKIAKVTLGLIFVGSSVFAQSLADAKKAIDAEQYQKAKGMLKNLTTTQPTNDENFFQLGWVYLLQDYADSAKASFTKGVAANPKSALNLVGLGVVAHLNKDEAGAASSFSQAIAVTAKKDSKPYLYIGKGYLLNSVDGKTPAATANAAIDALNKGKAANPKDPEIFLELGNAYRSQIKSSEAYENYSASLTLDPKSAAAHTAQGVLITYAENYEEAEKQFKEAIAIDANYGPAYRAWAESDLRQAQNNLKVAPVKVKEGVEHYRTYLSLTDQSVESLMRYADFLTSLGDYKALQEVATTLSKSAGTNIRVYRYLGYAAYENKDYPAGITAMNNWFAKADAKRILPRDYMYLGRLQMASGQDSVGIATLKKAMQLDTTQVDVYYEIAKTLYAKKKYTEAGEAYGTYVQKSRQAKLTDHFSEGLSYYYGFTIEQTAKAAKDKTFKPDSTILTKADSAFSYVAQKTSANPYLDAYLYRARVNEAKDADRNNIKGLAKPFYEKYIELAVAKGSPDKAKLVEAYDYLGYYYLGKEKDDAKALENFTKAKALDPADPQAAAYFARKAGGKSK
jgi:cytochrome c-type biogenesis protein CcmH/NrfG